MRKWTVLSLIFSFFLAGSDLIWAQSSCMNTAGTISIPDTAPVDENGNYIACADGSDSFLYDFTVAAPGDTDMSDYAYIAETPNGLFIFENGDDFVLDMAGMGLTAGDVLNLVGFGWDVENINGIVNFANGLCPGLDAIIGQPICPLLDELITNAADPANPVENLQQALDVAASFGTPIFGLCDALNALSAVDSVTTLLAMPLCYAVTGWPDPATVAFGGPEDNCDPFLGPPITIHIVDCSIACPGVEGSGVTAELTACGETVPSDVLPSLEDVAAGLTFTDGDASMVTLSWSSDASVPVSTECGTTVASFSVDVTCNDSGEVIATAVSTYNITVYPTISATTLVNGTCDTAPTVEADCPEFEVAAGEIPACETEATTFDVVVTNPNAPEGCNSATFTVETGCSNECEQNCETPITGVEVSVVCEDGNALFIIDLSRAEGGDGTVYTIVSEVPAILETSPYDYSFTVGDDAGCTADFTGTLEFDCSDVSCTDPIVGAELTFECNADGTATLSVDLSNVSGGDGTEYSLNQFNLEGAVVSSPYDYNFSVSDETGCSGDFSGILEFDCGGGSEECDGFTIEETLDCDQVSGNFTIDFTLSGGSGLYNVFATGGGGLELFDYADETFSLDGNGVDAYDVEVVDLNTGCTLNISGSVNCGKDCTGMVTEAQELCADDNSGDYDISFSITGGTAPFTLSGSVDITESSADFVIPGFNDITSVTIYIEDQLGCRDTVSFDQGVCTKTAIELLSFSGSALSTSSNLIEWTTATEENNAFFSIEKSVNGVDFAAIGHMAGAGTSYSALNYSFVDQNVNESTSYYRLTQTDVNGSSVIASSIIRVHSENASISIIGISPVPANDVVHIQLQKGSEVAVQIFDLAGKLVHQSTAQGSFISIDINALNAGAYFIVLKNESDLVSAKFLKN